MAVTAPIILHLHRNGRLPYLHPSPGPLPIRSLCRTFLNGFIPITPTASHSNAQFVFQDLAKDTGIPDPSGYLPAK